LSGGGGGIDTKSIKNTVQEYLTQLRATIEQGREKINQAAAEAIQREKNARKDYRGQTDRLSTEFWNGLGIENEALIERASALVDEYDGDVFRALNVLADSTFKLNEAYGNDMGKIIDDYGSAEKAIDAQLLSDTGINEAKYTESRSQAREQYVAETGAEIDAAKSEQMSLGDQFVQKTDSALGKFESFISPENTTATLDALSKSIFNTRQQMLAEADPRALELSAIADENAAAMMSGRIGADVQANVARSSAMRALQGGFGASSEMGRGLTARDLGLTSLDLMRTGFDMNERQRRLNYDTRVAGVETTALGTFGEMRAGQDALMRNTIGVAESDRNQRSSAVQNASAQKLGTFDATFASRLDESGSIFDTNNRRDIFRAEAARDTNLRGSGMKMGVVGTQYDNLFGLSDTIFNTTTGTALQRATVGLGVSDTINRTNVGGLGTIVGAGYDREGAIYGGRVQTALTTGGWKAAYEGAALNAMAGGLSEGAATEANIPVLQAGIRNTNAQNNARIWGSALQSGTSLAGAFMGSSSRFNAMPNRATSYWSQANSSNSGANSGTAWYNVG
jgi:hypothetical protein